MRFLHQNQESIESTLSHDFVVNNGTGTESNIAGKSNLKEASEDVRWKQVGRIVSFQFMLHMGI